MAEEPSGQLLIVDDDPELLQFLLEELSQDSIVCQGANCGAEALLLLRQQHFDLVVLDWNLPDFNGLEICRRLRSSGDTTPVLMLTAHHDLEDRVQALDLGADDYITKPFELEELIARVRSMLRRRGWEQSSSAQSAHSMLRFGGAEVDFERGEVSVRLPLDLGLETPTASSPPPSLLRALWAPGVAPCVGLLSGGPAGCLCMPPYVTN